MKIVHLSDTHLGYRGQGLSKLVEIPSSEGITVPQWQVDLMCGFVRAIDSIVYEVQPDLVIHSGDLFDHARPTPHILNFAMSQFKRLSEVGIPVILIEGNHSYPRDRSHGHILKLLGYLPGMTVICEGTTPIQIGDLLIHPWPYRTASKDDLPQLTNINNDYFNILVTYGVADGQKFFKTGRPAPNLNIKKLASLYHYIALGHHHRFAQVPGTDRAFYAGSTAMVTWGDFYPGHRFGFNVITFGSTEPSIKRKYLKTRSMHAYGLDNAEGLSPKEVLGFLDRQATAVPPDKAYCQVIVERLDPLARRELGIQEVENLFDTATGLMLSLRAREQRWDAVRASLLEGGLPATRYAQLVSQTDGDEAFKVEVLALGQDLLARAYEKIGAEDIKSDRKRGEDV